MLDLRENGGGHLTEAIGLVNLFVPKGPVVQLRETGGRVEVLESEDKGVAYSGPLTILVDRFSASASEIFAAAMQDYGRGVVIGQETYGKGSVQNLYPLDRYALGQDPGYGQLTVTIGMYYRVTGDSTQNRGVQPDITPALRDQPRGSRRELARRLAAVEPDPPGDVQARGHVRADAARVAA